MLILDKLVFVGIIFLLILPFILTIKNILEIFSKKKELSKRAKRWRLITDMTIMILGLALTIILFTYTNNFVDYDYQFTIHSGTPDIADEPVHSPIATWTIPTILALVIISVFSYIILRLFKNYDLPPLFNVICIAGMYIGIILSMAWIIQITNTLIQNSMIIQLYLLIQDSF